jgi:transposase
MKEFVPGWSLAPIVQAPQSLRGVDLIVAVTFVTEVGGLQRSTSADGISWPRTFRALHWSNGRITKAGNARVRQLLVEGA